MNRLRKAFFVSVVALACVNLAGLDSVEAQAAKYRSPWTSDAKYENIQFQFTRQKDPSGTGKGYYQFGYKNNSTKKWRLFYKIYGAGRKDPISGFVVLGAGEKKGGAGKAMFFFGEPGGGLRSVITKLEAYDTKLKGVRDDFEALEKTLSPKEEKELSNKEISRILKDNRSEIKARAKRQQKQFASQRTQSQKVANKSGVDVVQKSTTRQNTTKQKNTETSSRGGSWILSPVTISSGSRFRLSSGGKAEIVLWDQWTAKYKVLGTGTWSKNGNRLNVSAKYSHNGKQASFDGVYQKQVKNPAGKLVDSYKGKLDGYGNVYCDFAKVN